MRNHIQNVNNIVNLSGRTVLDLDWHDNIEMWLQWYEGKVDEFHRYKHFNGKSYQSLERVSLQMPKQIAEDWGTLLYNDRASIKVGENEQEILDELLKANHFESRFSAFIEQYMALGIGATVEYRDERGNPKINFIQAPMVFPLKSRNGEITDCVFASVEDDTYYINIHELQPNGKYKITNEYYKFDISTRTMSKLANKNVKQSYYSDVKLFQIYKPGIANNIDMFSPFGVSVYGNALDRIKVCDLLYDSFRNEFKLGKKRIFIRDDLLTSKPIIDERGNQTSVPIFDPNDTEFFSLPNDDEGGEMLREVNGALRVQDHINGIQSALNMLSDACGLGTDRYNFQNGNVYTNTTQVISTQSKLYKTLLKHEKVLRESIVEMVKALLYLKLNRQYEDDITVDFDDSIIEDTGEIQRRALLELQSGVIDVVEYYVQVYKYTEEQAIEFFEKMKARQPQQPEEPDME